MDISNFSRTISKGEWDNHIDFLANESVKNATKEKIHSSLVDYIDRNVSNEKFGVLLSGGIDSSLIARICQLKQYNFRCFCVGIDGSKDIIYAQKVAKSLGLELIVRVYNYNEVEKLLKKVVTILPKPVIECDNYTEYIVKVTVSAVLLGSLSLGNENIFLSGIGAEELFAGYQRHQKAIDGGGEWRGQPIEDIDKESISGLKRMHNLVYLRDRYISLNLSRSIIAPYLSNNVIIQAMNIDKDQKIDNLNNKKVLRELALDLGIPEEFSYRKKKGAQYGSGFDKAISKLAKLNKFNFKKRYLESLVKSIKE